MMARVPLITDSERPDLEALVARLKSARGGRLLNLYRALLNSPAFAAAWLDFNSTVRFSTTLDAPARELAIMRVAILNGADYQLRIHGTRHAASAGVSAEQVDALPDWRAAGIFSAQQRAVLAYADAMTSVISVDAAVHDELRAHFNSQQIVELTVLIGAYNMHTRVVRALGIDAEPETLGG